MLLNIFGQSLSFPAPLSNVYILKSDCDFPAPQAYTSKRCILIQVHPVPNAYTKSGDAYIHNEYMH